MESETMTSRQALSLIDLPVDILQPIIQTFKTRGHLFLPRYGVRGSESDNLQAPSPIELKYEEYYGKQPVNEEEGANDLINLSMTCKLFHEMIMADLYKTVVLRTTPKSLQSVLALSQSPRWSRVTHLIFAGVWETRDPINPDPVWYDVDKDTWNAIVARNAAAIKSKMQPLTSIMSNLPPNLEVLTLDFPQTWENRDDCDDFQSDYNDDAEGEEALRELEINDFFRAQHAAVFSAIGSDTNIISIASKTSFELRLHNITPITNSSYTSQRFRRFLNHVTKFKLGLFHDEPSALMAVCTMPVTAPFCERLSGIFFSHLDRCTHLTIHASSTWTLGQTPGNASLDLPLPTTTAHLPVVSHLDLRYCFIDPTLIDFLSSHLSTITSIDMTDCYASGSEPWDWFPYVPTWADLFRRLSTATNPRPLQLTHVAVTNPSDSLSHTLEGYNPAESLEASRELVHDILKQQKEEKNQGYQDGGYEASKDDVIKRQKRVYCYAEVDGKYGFIYPEAEKNIERFLAGDDHNEWIKLAELVESNVRKVRCEFPRN